jgi:pimeloyl-ACP methyl ester carboxylesterase
MAKHRSVPDDHKPFSALPVQMVTVGNGDERVAVHVKGTLSSKRLPLLCVPGYHRNMADFAEFAGHFQRLMGEDWPMVLVDMRGRGRSTDRADKNDYTSVADARDLTIVCDALGIESAVVVGQGYGGQVTMALAALRPTLIAGTILVDAGPVSDPRGLVRLRNNLRHIAEVRGEAPLNNVFRRILAVDYPGSSEAELDALAARTHYIDARQHAKPLFDTHLLAMLETFEHDDVLVAQWPLFNALALGPLMMLRTQLTDQLRRETFEEMSRRRVDAVVMSIDGQGSPALLNSTENAQAIAEFVRHVCVVRGKGIS